MNIILIAAGAVLFGVGVLTKEKDKSTVQVVEAKSMPIMENVENEQKLNFNETDSSDHSGRDNPTDLAESTIQE